ncbi:MAG TPA: aldose 1-epimerase family protein [Pirellulaceae bacterium]|nr:aldose 1-epimerase family protein [Pirellulaceae bacterium]HMO92669.1 aldose 1-epimerase family protein [Pirellulaceae bacterium]HMP70583.1 aldose 1-epimerase family protein [Pirellulaceae bacterium]
MSLQTYALSDCLRKLKTDPSEQVFFGSDQFGFSVREFYEGKSCGVTLVTLRCHNKSICVLPTRGLGIWRAFVGDVRFGWDSPVNGPVHPHWVNLAEPDGMGWLDGFDELLVRCGLMNNGAPEFDANGGLIWPLHGSVANLPATDVMVEMDDEKQQISISGTVHETRFHFHNLEMKARISISGQSNEIEIVDSVTNRSNRPCSFQMLYHFNFGPPLLEEGSQVFAPVSQIEPRDEWANQALLNWSTFRASDPDFREEVFFLQLVGDELGNSLALLVNRQQDLGVCVRFNLKQLPYFTLWKNTVGLRDGYVTGLEPGTNYPNPRSVEEQAGRVVHLATSETFTMRCSLAMLTKVADIANTIAVIESMTPQQIIPGSDGSA